MSPLVEWGNVTATSVLQPPAKDLGGLVYDARDGYMLWFGGYGVGGITNQTWAYENGSWTDLTPSLASAPPVVVGMAMGLTYDASDGYVLLFGGGFSTPYNATWKFEAGAWANITSEVTGHPPARSYPGMAYDTSAQDVVMFGGWSGSKALGDTWTYHAGVWRDVTPAISPSARLFPLLADDPTDGGVLLTGGEPNGGAQLNETWSYSAGRWNESSARLPSSAGWFEGTVGSANSSVLGFGCGQSMQPSACPYIYAYSAGSWINLSPSAPLFGPPPDGRLSAYPPTGGVMSWGGDSRGSPVSATWLTLGPFRAAISSAPGRLAVGAPLNLTVTEAGGVSPFAYAYSGLPSGCASADTAQLTCTPSGTGNFSIVVSVRDGAGRIATNTTSVAVTPLPSLYLAGSERTIDVNQSVQFIAAPSWGMNPYEFVWQGLPPGCPVTGVDKVSCRPTTPGAYSVEVTALQAGGPSVTSLPSTLLVNPAPNVTVSATGWAGLAPFSPELSAFVAGGTAPVTIHWIFSDGFASDGPRVQHSLAAPGTYSVQATVQDAAGETATSATMNLTVASALTVAIEGSALRESPVGPIWWNATAAGGFPPYQFAWSFGDSANGTGANALHNYAQPGNYSAVVLVEDSQGNVVDAVGQVNLLALSPATPNHPPAVSSFPVAAAATLGALAGAVVGAVSVALALRRRRRS